MIFIIGKGFILNVRCQFSYQNYGSSKTDYQLNRSLMVLFVNDHRLKPVASYYRLKPNDRLSRRLRDIKIIIRLGGVWFFMYSNQTSSVTFPLDPTQYPLAQRCWPQYLFLSESYSDSNLWELFPFKYWTALDTDKLGGMLINICTWSRLIDPAWTIISLLIAISRNNSLHLNPTSPPSNW